jgi:hypothetical protein
MGVVWILERVDDGTLLFHVQTSPFVRNTGPEKEERIREWTGKAFCGVIDAATYRLFLYLATDNVVFEDTVQLLRILLQFGHALKQFSQSELRNSCAPTTVY